MADPFAALGLTDDDRRAWETSGLPGDALDDWLVDRVARRPEGDHAREVYGADDVHDFARRAVLDALGLAPGDRLLEVGCGGGLLLRDAALTGAEVTGVDHSEAMLDVAQRRAPAATLVYGAAEDLPLVDESFTAVASSMVLLFVAEPLRALAECHRVLVPGGRLAVYTAGPALRGTPAAPEPVASLGHFHDDTTLRALARTVGFAHVQVLDDDGGQLLTARRAPAPPGPSIP